VDAEYEPTQPYVFEGYRRLKTRLLSEQRISLAIDAIDRGWFRESEPIMVGAVSGILLPDPLPDLETTDFELFRPNPTSAAQKEMKANPGDQRR